MTTQPYPFIENDSNAILGEFCRESARLREQDIADFSNLSNVFMKGRKVGKIPTGSSDVSAGDRIGDFNYDASYLYICVDNSGAAWRRITLGSW
jgi:hypothetical protein